jgi:hypothetical protein
MRLRLAVPLAAMVAGLIVLTGCGGGDDTSSTSAGASGTSGEQGAALTKSEFLTQGNAICAQGTKEIQAAGKELFTQSQAPTPAEQEKFATDTLIPSIQSQIDGIEALTPPAGDEDQVNAITDAAQSALDKAKADPSLLTDQGGQSDPFAEANKLANSYGLDECAG